MAEQINLLESLQQAMQALNDKRWDEAERLCQAVLAQQDGNPDALHLLALSYKMSGRLAESLPVYERLVTLYANADFIPLVLGNYSNALREAKDYTRARECLERGLAMKPDAHDLHSHLGLVWQDLGDYIKAGECFARAVALKPDYADAWNNYGGVLQKQGKLYEALDAYRRSLALSPNSAVAHYNMGNLLADSNHLAQAVEHYRLAQAANPDYIESAISWLRQLQNACDWADLPMLSQRLRDWVAQRRDGRIFPFAFIGIDTNGREQLDCARQWAENKYYPAVLARQHGPYQFIPRAKPRLKIGYLSSDFHNHATAYLLAEIIELHDRDQFEVIAYSAGPDDGKDMRQRLMQSFDRFVDIQHDSYEDAAHTIYQDGIDILVDLKGYTRDTRSAVLAFRPAPVQVNYLGYPGTLGAPIADYLITDRFIVPPERAADYVEKLVYMPDCYQPNDRRRRIADPVTRAEAGLPEGKLVFCSFNHTYKITPAMFDLWCQILQAVPNSVLWLLRSNPVAQENLAREAAARGILPARLIFAEEKPLAEHLSRFRCADIFLDTFPVNAHTTASDALWAGVPVVTLAGETFISRVAGSLLNAVGLPELVAYSPQQYVTKAVELAGDPDRVSAYKDRLASQRETLPLFDAERYTRALERRYQQMWQQCVAGRLEPLIDDMD